MHALMIGATILWFVLNGLLWYARPNEVMWFWGSMGLGVTWFTGFFWYVTRTK